MKSIKEGIDNLEFLVNCYEGINNTNCTNHTNHNMFKKTNDDFLEINFNDNDPKLYSSIENNKKSGSFFQSSNDVNELINKINIQIEKLNFQFCFKTSINDSNLSRTSISTCNFHESFESEKKRMGHLIKKFKKLKNENLTYHSQDTDFSSRKSKNLIFEDDDDFDDELELNKIDSLFDELSVKEKENETYKKNEILKENTKEKFCNCPIF